MDKKTVQNRKTKQSVIKSFVGFQSHRNTIRELQQYCKRGQFLILKYALISFNKNGTLVRWRSIH